MRKAALNLRWAAVGAIAWGWATGAASMTAEPGGLPTEPSAGPRVEASASSGVGLRPRREGGAPGGPLSLPGRVSLYGDDPYLSPTVIPGVRLAQFQLPTNQPREGTLPSRQAAQELAKDLEFQYSFGSDTDYTYDRNQDLDSGRRGNLQLLAPTVFLLGTLRPYHWLDINLGATFEQQLRIKEETLTRLPDGTVERPPRRGSTTKVDVANIVIKNIPDHPLEITLGRRDFEDPRLSLYDTTLDGVHVRYKGDSYVTEVSYVRENQWDLTLFEDIPKSSVSNYILYHEYRGIEDHKIAAYAIAQLDQLPRSEGRPQLFGVRAYGRPTDEFNYWMEYGVVRGVDEAATPQPLHGAAFDFGATYRYPQLLFSPCLTFGLAYGSGDGDTRDGVNREYRQTGLQSNETKFCGPAKFKRYGEFVDPELSNLRIFTLGVGFRPAANVHVDIVGHQFELNQFAVDTRGSAITAEMNRITARRTKDMGREVDLIVAFRRLFDTKFAVDVRLGVFFPGSAFLRNAGTNRNPDPRDPNKGLRVHAILSY